MYNLLQLWDTNELVPAEQFPFEGKVYCHDISEIGSHNLVAVGTSVNHVNLVDIRAGANIQHLRGHTDAVLVCKWSNRDENLLATGN